MGIGRLAVTGVLSLLYMPPNVIVGTVTAPWPWLVLKSRKGLIERTLLASVTMGASLKDEYSLCEISRLRFAPTLSLSVCPSLYFFLST